jgi:hypothetical protein
MAYDVEKCPEAQLELSLVPFRDEYHLGSRGEISKVSIVYFWDGINKFLPGEKGH